jgi:exonuclease SbcC
MIKYDYRIERHEGDEIRNYVPDQIPKELSDVVYIEGPNSSGKSTLLNLIAIGFYADRLSSNEINPELKEKIDNLLASDYQKLRFEIELNNDALSTTIKASKENLNKPEIKLVKIERGVEKPIPFNQFKKEYRLIYDIPNNPLDRLKELLREVETSLLELGNKIARLNNTLYETIKNVSEGKNPKRISELNEKLENSKELWSKKNSAIEDKKEQLDLLKRFFNIKFYLFYLSKRDKLQKDLRDKSKLITKKKQEVKKNTKEEAALLKQIKDQRLKVLELYNKLADKIQIVLPPSEKAHIELWESVNCNEEISDPKLNNTLRQEIIHIRQILTDQLNSTEGEIEGEARLLKKLSSILEEFLGSELKIPGTELSIDEFFTEIKYKLDEYQTAFLKTESLNNVIELFDELEGVLKTVIENVKKCRKNIQDQVESEEGVSTDELNDQVNAINSKLQNTESKISHYAKELGKLNIETDKASILFDKLKREKSLDIFQQTEESQLLEIINGKATNIKEETEILNRIDKSVSLTIAELERIESKKPHKYQAYSEKLESYRIPLQILEKKISDEFYHYLKSLMESKTGVNKNEQKIFAQRVSEYLAQKIGFIRHIDGNYKVKSIDILDKCIKTETGKIIRFADLGTGQSQGAYIEGLLNMEENRKIIALFDEVAMMDSKTMKPIIEKLRDLYKSKKLLCGIIVQKADSVNTKALI